MNDLSNLEQAVVDQIDEGWARWKIAQNLGIGETRVREVIKRLCEQYQCSMKGLPDRFREENR